MKDLNILVRKNILELKAYSSARDEYKGLRANVFLDANENPYNAPINRYPDPLQQDVKKKISTLKSVGGLPGCRLRPRPAGHPCRGASGRGQNRPGCRRDPGRGSDAHPELLHRG